MILQACSVPTAQRVPGQLIGNRIGLRGAVVPPGSGIRKGLLLNEPGARASYGTWKFRLWGVNLSGTCPRGKISELAKERTFGSAWSKGM